MSGVNRSFLPVWFENGKCPAAKRHFRGCAREVYGYLEKLAQNHGGFVFPTVADIVRHTKKWKTRLGAKDSPCARLPDYERYSRAECKRVIRAFRELGILGTSCVRTVHGCKYRGWQFYPHECWTESGGGICELKHWERYSLKSQWFMGNNEPQNEPVNEPQNEPAFAH